MAKQYSLGQLGDHEIKQLKVYKTVVDCGGLSAAETALNIGRSTISLHISSLESRLNLVLCKRGRGGFSLTPEGQVIYEMTEKLLESLESFRTTVNNLNTSLMGQLRLALSDTVSLDPRSRFPDLIAEFSGAAPEVTITTHVDTMSTIERMVLNDEADIGFIPYHRRLDGLDYRPLYSDTCFLYCAKQHPIASMSLEEQRLQTEIAPMTHAGLKPHEGVSEQLASMNLSAISYFYASRLALIFSGRYLGFLPEYFAQPYEERSEIVRVDPAKRFYHLEMAVISKKTIAANKPKELFLEVIDRVFQLK